LVLGIIICFWVPEAFSPGSGGPAKAFGGDRATVAFVDAVEFETAHDDPGLIAVACPRRRARAWPHGAARRGL
jgi:hypothetical protein